MIQYTGTFSVHFMEADETRAGLSEGEAHQLAQQHVGNSACASPFPGTWLYGPGDGTTSVMVRRDFIIPGWEGAET